MGEEEVCMERLAKTSSAEVVYLYCFARSPHLSTIEAKTVDDGDDLFLRRFLDIAAVISTVPGDEFCSPAAEERLKDLSWVGARACRHEKVVEDVMRRSPVFPVRFGTIFSSLERLDGVLQKHHDSISTFLDQVEGKDEWGVKAFVNRAQVQEELFRRSLAAHRERLASSSPGMRYFQEQRLRTSVEKKLKDWLKEVCEQITRDLSNYASQCCTRKVLPIEAKGLDMVLNSAFLVPRNVVTEFRARIDLVNAEQLERGLVLHVSGPWPPYSFSPSLDAEGDG